MIIKFSPQRRDDTLEIIKQGDTLIVNGESFDFSPMGDGDTLPYTAIDSHWFSADVDKNNGELEVSFILPNPWNYSQEQAFPSPILNVKDGLVPLPQPLSDEESYLVSIENE